MNGLSLIILATVTFTLIILFLVALILLAKSKLMPSGSVNIVINDNQEESLHVPVGGKLLPTLAVHQIYLCPPAAVKDRVPSVDVRYWKGEVMFCRQNAPC